MIQPPGPLLTAAEDEGLGDAAMDLTALIDVLFMLLVFLILTANTAQYAVTIDLPRADDRPASQAGARDAPLLITVHADAQRWTVDGATLFGWEAARAAIEARLSAPGPRPEVVVAGDRDAPLEKAVRLLTLLESKGVPATEFLMEPQ